MIEFGKKEPIFRSQEDEKLFEKEGYIVKDFLSEEDVSRLVDSYEKLHPDGVRGFYCTTYNRDLEHRASVEEEILKITFPRIEAIFKDFRIFFGSFIVKNPGPESELNLHQDMSLVDESKYTGINIWCPLVSLDKQNGAIEVIPQSHRLFPTYRGASIPAIYDDIAPELKKYTKPMYLKAGQAIIFDQSIIHYSPANLSKNPRPVINVFISQKNASILICYFDKDQSSNKIEFFEQDENFLRNFQQFGDDIFSRPKIGKSIGFREYNFPKLTSESLKQKYGKSQKRLQVKRRGFFERLIDRLN